MGDGEFIKWFSELSQGDIQTAGGKGSVLAEIYNKSFPVPPGFVITSGAYEKFIERSGLKNWIVGTLQDLDPEDTEVLIKVSEDIGKRIAGVEFPRELGDSIIEAYEILDVEKNDSPYTHSGALEILRTNHEPPFVAVRSSPTLEDSDIVGSGHQLSFLNIKGKVGLLNAVKKCFASLFNPNALYFRIKKGISDDNLAMPVIIQKMVDSDKSGVVFSKNPVLNNRRVLLESVWGFGTGISLGIVNPDRYFVDENVEHFNISRVKVSEKNIAVVRDSGGENKLISLTPEKSSRQVLDNYEIKRLSQYARQLEEVFGYPQKLEFAISNGEIYILQSKVITSLPEKLDKQEIQGDVLLSGIPASQGVRSGIVRFVSRPEDLIKVKPGDIIVTKSASPELVMGMGRAAGLITEDGGTTSHALINSRSFGIPAIVSTEDVGEILHEGDLITIDGSSGKVVQGRCEIQGAEVRKILPTKSKVSVSLSSPGSASRAALSGAKGCFVQLEKIITSTGKHPLKFVKDNTINEYISAISKGVKDISQNFSLVSVQGTDIKSDELRNLIGAPQGVEGNPMLGNHGVRFLLRYKSALQGELIAMKEIADEFPGKKFNYLIPGIVSLEEFREVKRISEEEVGIPENLGLGVVVETPASVQIINELCSEGVSKAMVDVDDLTQLTLMVDKNNGDVKYIYDETSQAILNSIIYLVRRCKRYGVGISISGQAVNDLNFLERVFSKDIDSFVTSPDAAYDLSKMIKKLEEPEFVEEDFSDNGFESVNTNVDVEDEILNELEDVIEYPDNKRDIPSLNDAIPVTSEIIEESAGSNEEFEEMQGAERLSEISSDSAEQDSIPDAKSLEEEYDEFDDEIGEIIDIY